MEDTCRYPTRKLLIWIGIVLIVLGGLSIAIQFIFNCKSDWLSIFGSISSIVGLAITCFQIFKVKDVAIQTNEAVQRNIKSVNKFLTFSDVSKALKIIDTIEVAMLDNHFEIVFVYLKELKDFLTDIQCNTKVSSIIAEELATLQTYVGKLTPDIRNLNSYLSSGKSFQSNVITKHVEEIKTLLSTISGEIKYTEL